MLLGSGSCTRYIVQDIQPTCIARVLPGVEQNRVDQIHYPVPNAAFVQIRVARNAVGRFRAMMQHVPMPVHVLMLVVLVNACLNISSFIGACISISNSNICSCNSILNGSSTRISIRNT